MFLNHTLQLVPHLVQYLVIPDFDPPQQQQIRVRRNYYLLFPKNNKNSALSSLVGYPIIQQMKMESLTALVAYFGFSVASVQLKENVVQSPAISEPYRLRKAEQIHDTLQSWKETYPDSVRVTSSQERYGLPRAGTDEDCPYDYNVTGCSNVFFTIQDFVAHPEGSKSSELLPEIFWNGAIHGDERLGAAAVMETASLLLEAATCESLPREVPKRSRMQELTRASECRTYLQERGIDNERRKWLAKLVSTRRIVVAPAVNAAGFDRNEKTEDSVDPDLDFPYEYHREDNVSACTKTITARTINSIFREHMFQVSISFHAGPRDTIGFSWGGGRTTGTIPEQPRT